MMNLEAAGFSEARQLSEQGKKHEAEEQYEEAASFFKQAYDLQHNGYAASRYIHCMYKQGPAQAQVAAKFARSIYSNFQDNIHITREYVWAIYYGYIKPKISGKNDGEISQLDEINFNMMINAGRRILELTKDELPCRRTVLTICKEAKVHHRWDIVFEIAQKLDPQTLSIEPNFLNGKRLASEYQLWLYANTRALLELERYDECITHAHNGISKFPDDKFFHWWLASAQIRRGDIEEGLRSLEELNCRFSEWYIQRDLAKAYVQLEKYDQANIWFCKAATSLGEIKAGVAIFTEMVGVLQHLERWQDAYNHLMLAWAVAAEQPTWYRRVEINKKLAVEFSNRYKDKLSREDSSFNEANDNVPLVPIFLKKCRDYWNKTVSSSRPQSFGHISNILRDKPFGFIKGAETDYFFKFRDFRGRGQPKLGMNVEFEIEKSFDQKKGKESLIAVNIRPNDSDKTKEELK